MVILLAACVALTLANTVDLDDAAKQAFVDLHNEYRRATGVDMPDLTWDEDLAAAAAEYSSKCEFAHPPNNPYGENIYLGWGPAYTDGASEAKKASDKWHTEIDNVDADWDCIANRPEATCGHYSQEVWAETTKIGCAITRHCQYMTYDMNMVFCEYSPRGNMMKDYDAATGKFIANPPY